MTIYKGFSTYNRNKKFRLTDFALAKQDLFNHFNIHKGEKLMNPDFGSIIWNLLYEPFTPEVKKLIVDDITRIAKYDPRIAVNNVNVVEYQYGLQVELTLTYVPNNQIEVLYMQFNQQSSTTN
jgi:phage baseplate assembly protein W